MTDSVGSSTNDTSGPSSTTSTDSVDNNNSTTETGGLTSDQQDTVDAADNKSSTEAQSVADSITGTDGLDSKQAGLADVENAADAATKEARDREAAEAMADLEHEVDQAARDAKARADAEAIADLEAQADGLERADAATTVASAKTDAQQAAEAIADVEMQADQATKDARARADAEAMADLEMQADQATKDARAREDAAAIADLENQADAAAKAATTTQHTVVAGDTMSKIARDAGVSLDKMIAANPHIADPNVIEIGQTLNVPASKRSNVTLEAQMKLAASGFPPGPFDGIHGPKTEAALKSFQRANGISPSGVVDAATAKALEAVKITDVNGAPMSPGLKGLLDRIAIGEGTSLAKAQKHGFKSGYDVTLGYGAFTPKSMKGKPLSEMTLGEVKKLQSAMLANPRNKFNSSAVGRYQIVGTTLRGLQRNMGLPDSAVFSPALQDKMAMELLEGRGLSRFQGGKLSAAGFQNNLAREWASIATTSGSTYYGQALGTTSKQIRAALATV